MASPPMGRRQSWIGRTLWKGSFHVMRLVLKAVSLVSHRAYMPLYNKVLSAWGMVLKGQPRYIAPDCYFDNIRMITLGHRVVLSTNVQFLTHDYSVTTALICAGREPATDIAAEREIVVGNNVFIGRNSLVMPGTVIGDNVIVGAGSVIRGVVPADSIMVGNPAERVSSLTEHAATIIEQASRWKNFRAD